MAGSMAKYEIGAGERSKIVRAFTRPKGEGVAAEYKALGMGDFNEYRIIDKERIE